MTLVQNIVRARMHTQHLTGHSFDIPTDVVKWLTAVQSQDFGPAKWSIAQRASPVTDTNLDQLFNKGKLLRTHVLRPTWHFVLPADIRWMLELTAPRVHALNAYYYRQLELEDAVFDKSRKLFQAALRGGKHLTRKQLQALLGKAGIKGDGLRLGYIMMHAELTGTICSGTLVDKKHSYALLEERAPEAKSFSRDKALAELTLRYFTSHGPATVRDFKWWSSLKTTEIREGLEMVSSSLESEIIDGVTFWFAESSPHLDVASPTVHLLQGYDEYIVGYSESKHVLQPSRGPRSLPENTMIFNGVLILNGRVGGHWKRTVKKASVTIEVALYSPLNRSADKALQEAVQRHGDFLGLPANLVTSEI